MPLAAILTDSDYGLFGKDPIGIIEFEGIIDAYPSEAHSISYTKTEYPTEDGESRTDNITKNPIRLVMEGFVSNLANPSGLAQIPGEARPVDAWQRIREIAAREDVVSVLTTLGLYENFLIVGFDTTNNRDNGTSLSVTLTLEEAEFSETQVTKFPAQQLAGPAADKSSTVDGGTKQSLTPSESQASLLKQGVDSLRSQFETLIGG